jgi:4-hydroxy-tetrahydrodipicolinate synthase
MSMPPHVVHPDGEGCYRYYQELGEALEISVMIQNYVGPIGTPMSAELMARMCREIPNVVYIKEETIPAPRMVGQVLAAAGEACKGVFGGQAGQYLLDEYRRGSCGNMPACQTTDLLQGVWDLLETGEFAAARVRFNRVLPLINYERLYGVALYKEVLYRRGVIDCRLSRTPGKELDQDDRIELDAILADISPLFAV